MEPAQPSVEPVQPAVERGQVVAALDQVDRGFRPQPPREWQPASTAAVQKAIEEVGQIIETLRGTLEDMEEVLETLELAERQKTTDQQEIEMLRRSLRQLHRPREGGPHPPRH